MVADCRCANAVMLESWCIMFLKDVVSASVNSNEDLGNNLIPSNSSKTMDT